MYDFQFDFMDSMAAVVRAHVAERSARGLVNELTTLKSIQSDITNLVALRKFSLGMLVSSRLHTLIAAVSYCSMLEYKNGGESLLLYRNLQTSKRSSFKGLRQIHSLFEQPVHI